MGATKKKDKSLGYHEVLREPQMLRPGRMMKIFNIRSVQEDREVMFFLMCRYKHRVKETKKQRNMIQKKEQEKTP